jgi:hypothetical protein
MDPVSDTNAAAEEAAYLTVRASSLTRTLKKARTFS